MAPWVAAMFGIAGAVAAERAFNAGAQGATPDRWRGADTESFFNDFDDKEEIAERTMRDCARSMASAWQSISMYSAAGAAIEAAASSQHADGALALFWLGVIVTILPITVRLQRVFGDIRYTKAWYKRLRWSEKRKYVHSQDFEEEDKIFASEYPKDAAILEHREGPRQPLNIPPQIP